MVFCKELNKEFPDKRSMFLEMKKNKEHIIGLKKATLKYTDWNGLQITSKSTAVKEINENSSTELKIGDTIYPVINTIGVFDSHGDVHLKGIWDRSVTDQQNKVYYIINHELELGKVISYPEDTEPMVLEMPWTDLGKDYEGTTEVLIFKVKLTDRGNAEANKAIIGKVALQNSVRMQYVRVKLCINDASEYFKEEYSNWNEYYPSVANKNDVDEAEFFWAVLEAKIYKEGSAVLFGSNEVTPILTTIEGKQNPPSGSSENSKIDPPSGSQKSKIITTYYGLI